MMAARIRAISANAALGVASVVLALAVAEVVVRLVAPQQLVTLRPDIWQPLDSVGWRFRPNVHASYSTGERRVHIVTDSSGFRTSMAGRPLGRRRILLIGDSFMAAVQVEYEASLAGLLEARLPSVLGYPVEIWNSGQVAWDPPQYYLQEQQSLRRSRFDLIVVSLYLGNDIVTRWPASIRPRQPEVVHRLRLPRRLSKRELVDALLYPLNDYLEVHSELFILLKTRMQSALMRLGLTARYFPSEFLRSDSTSSGWHVTTEICEAMASTAHRYRVPVVFVLVPTPFQTHRAVFGSYARAFKIDPASVDLDQPTRLMGDSLRAHGLLTLNALPGFRAAADSGAQLYGHVDPHLSPAGHDILERLVEPTVAGILRAARQDGSQASGPEE